MHIDSHYAASLPSLASPAPLSGNMSTQTCVIGAGFAGLTTARELARQGHQVVLIEANLVGWAASGRNGGFVSAGFARSMSSVATVTGQKTAKKLYNLSAQGRDYIRDTIYELQQPDIILGKGWLKLLRHNKISDLAQMRDEMATMYDTRLRLVAGSELRDFVRSDKYHGALLDEDAFHIQPLQYAQLLAYDIKNHGGFVFENTRCTNLEFDPAKRENRWKVVTPNGQIYAQNVVLATSAYGGPHAKLNRAILPVATYVVSSAPAPELLNEVITFTGCISDTRRSGDYYRTIGTGKKRRLIWGGRITTFRTQPKRLAQLLKNDIVNVYPELKNLEIERAWSGLMGYAFHKMPIVRELEKGLWAASAFGGQGLNTSAMAGILISAAINQRDNRYQLFDAFGARWNGGMVGRLATQLEYWRLQFLDNRDEFGQSLKTAGLVDREFTQV